MTVPILLFLVLVGCSTVPVGKCGTVADYTSKEEHRSMVIHPRGCYAAWDQEASPEEAERLALLHCSETNADAKDRCKIVATDGLICPRSLKDWIQERLRNKGVTENTRSGMDCESGRAFIVKSVPGTKPPPVNARASLARKDLVEFLGLGVFDLGSSETMAFGRTPDSKANWVVTEALHFVKRKDGKLTCVFKASSGYDPTKHFETVFTVQDLGCFAL